VSAEAPEKVKSKKKPKQQDLDDEKSLRLFKKLEINKKVLKERLGADVSYDIKIREMNIAEKEIAFFYVNGLMDSKTMTIILNQMVKLKREEIVPDVLKHFLERYLTDMSVDPVRTFDDAITQMLAGVVLLVIDDEETALLIDVRDYPGRNPQEPDTEKVVRGARDGFTENIVVNTALTRRRIRDENLRMVMLKVGLRSKTDICLAYLEDVADPGLLHLLQEKIKQIEVDGLPMGEKTLEEFVMGKNWNPYPMVRYTERPDVAAVHLLEGHILIFVDTSPSVMITPTTFFHHVQHAEEFRQKPAIGAYLRWIRFIGIFCSLFLTPLWMFFALHKGFLPNAFAFIGPKNAGSIPIFYQFLIAEIGVDLIRMAALHTPTPLATATGLIAAVMIGEVAIKVGLFMPETILYMALAAIGMFATPSYELSMANRISRLVLLAAVYFLGIPGLIYGITALIILLATTTSLNTPYLWPFIPFNFPALRHVLVRSPIPSNIVRPSIVHPINDTKR
jgi:stage V sporulation protein AF